MLITKGKNTCAPSKDTVNASIACGGILYAIILVAKNGGAGPCFNPAIGVVLTVFQNFMLDMEDKTHLYQYVWVYTTGPVIGAVIAGLIQIVHAKTIDDIGEAAEE